MVGLFDIESIKADSFIDSNENNENIRVAALLVQDTIIDKVVGTCLSEFLKELICSGDICKSEYSGYKFLLDEFIHKIFIWGVSAELLLPTSFKTRNIGVHQQTDEGVVNSSFSNINSLKNYYETRQNFYIKKAQEWLCCNSNKFPELCGCECCWYQDHFGSAVPNFGLNLKPLRVRFNREGYHLNKCK